MKLWIMRALFFVLYTLSKLPRSSHRVLGKGLGRLLWALPLKRHAITVKNLEQCFPELTHAQRLELALENAYHAGRAVFDMGAAWFWPDECLDETVAHTITGHEALVEHYARGEGVLLLAKHALHLELGHRLLSKYITGCGVGRAHDDPYIRDLIYKGRKKSAEEVADKNNPLAFVRWLKQGKTVVYLPDQDYGLKGAEVVDFFKTPAATLTAPARIARMSGARVYFFDSYYEGEVLHLKITPCAFDAACHKTFVCQLNDYIEKAVRRQPAQYLWQHRRFKSTLTPAFYTS